MNKRIWKIAFVLTPLIMLVMTLYYSNTIIRYFEDSVFISVKEEKMKAMNIFANNIDELVNAGFSWETDGSLYDRQIRLYIDMLDSDGSTLVALISKDFELVTDEADSDLFKNEEIMQSIENAIRKENVGRTEIFFDGGQMELFFHAIPLDDVEYWVLIGVDRTRIVNNLDLDKLRIPIFIIGLLFIVSTMDSIWQRIMKIRTQ